LKPMAVNSVSLEWMSLLRTSLNQSLDVISLSVSLSIPNQESPLRGRSLLTTVLEMRLIHWATCSAFFPKNRRVISSSMWTMTRPSSATLPVLTPASQRMSTAASSFRSSWPMTRSLFSSRPKRTQASSKVSSWRDANIRMLIRIISSSLPLTCQSAVMSRSMATVSTLSPATSSLRSGSISTLFDLYKYLMHSSDY